MIYFKRIIFILFTRLLVSGSAFAQEKDLGSWNTIAGKVTFNNKWSAYTEFQLKSLSFYDRFYYYEIKGGITYSFLPRYSFTVGTGFNNTFKGGEEYDNYSRQKEVRFWEQLIMDQKLSIVEIEHRYRIEQRFKDNFENRFRYRLNVSVPLNKRKITVNTLYLSVYNELFFTDQQPHFSRNRFHTGLGYVFDKNISLESGWLRQVDFNKDQTRRKNYFLLSVSFQM